MRLKLGPYCASLVLGYRGHGKKRGVIRFDNGFTLRRDGIALYLWKLGPNDYEQAVGA